MPIDNVSNIRRLPVLGKIRLGLKVEGEGGKSYPRSTDYFVCPDEVMAVYGEQPKELPIMFPADDLELVASQWYKCYSYSQGLICKGDGKSSQRKIDADNGDFANRDSVNIILADADCGPEACPMYQNKQCRKVMSLLFLLYEVPGLGVYQLDTGSFNSIVNVNSQLAEDGFLRPFTKGKISFIPLLLSLKPKEVNPLGAGRQTIQILTLKAQVKLADIIQISRQAPTAILLPTIEEEEPPEDLEQADNIIIDENIPKSEAETEDAPIFTDDETASTEKTSSEITKDDVPDITAALRLCSQFWAMTSSDVCRECGYNNVRDLTNARMGPFNIWLTIKEIKEPERANDETIDS